MNRDVLLIEPDYRNKYPPVGLMKIATYYKQLGDDVVFFKGNLQRVASVPFCMYSFDIVAVTTLFTFEWKRTIETIQTAKKFCKPEGRILVGGIAATILPEEIMKATGVKPITGLLNKPRMLGDDNDILIDELPPDYSILEQIEYRYPENDAYLAYSTRGCINSCPFCAVKTLEPEYKGYIDIKKQVRYVDKYFGKKRKLLMLDNNVFASQEFDQIIDDIKACGFQKGATYIGPKGKERIRWVDFNQGLDARLADDHKMARLAELNIKPVRIAFDHWTQRDIYERAIKLAAKHGLRYLSNYMLYNFQDKPEELYYRLRLNIDLADELDIRIHSFPMKYHPIDNPDYFMNRNYLGPHWNRKFIRAVQAILHATMGKVGRGKSFFELAWGKDIQEFYRLLWLPEVFIINRSYYRETAQEWERQWKSLPYDKLQTVKKLVAQNDFSPDLIQSCGDRVVRDFLAFYRTRKIKIKPNLERKNNVR